MNPSSASSFRRMACGLCLLIGPAMLFVASILDPAAGEGDETEDRLEAIKGDPDVAELSAALEIFGFAVTAIGIIGLVHVIRSRGVVLANIGGVLAVFGMIMFSVATTGEIYELNNVEHLDLGIAVNLSEDLGEDYWAPQVVLIPAMAGTLVGFLLLGAAIIRSRVAHVAAAVLIIVGILAIPFSTESKVVAVVASGLLLAGWGLVGLKLLGMKDEQWEGRAPAA